MKTIEKIYNYDNISPEEIDEKTYLKLKNREE